MLAGLTVKWTLAENQAEQYKQYASLMQNLEDRINEERAGLSFKIRSSMRIDAALKKAAGDTERHASNLKSLHNTLSLACETYRASEIRIIDYASGGISQVLKRLDDEFGSDIDKDYLLNAIRNYFTNHQQDPALWSLGAVITSAGHVIESGRELWEDAKDKVVSATTYKRSVGVEGDLISGSGKYTNGLFSAEGEYAVGSYSANADFTAQIVDEDGNFRPGVSAEAGGSYTLLEASGSTKYGNEYVNAFAAGGITVLSASAMASAKAGFDEKGKFNAKVNAEAGVTLIEARGEAGIDVMGVKGKATGELKVGVDAHAEAGYSDGVITFEIGASLGVGGSVGFEVDVGDAVDALQGMANNLFPW